MELIDIKINRRTELISGLKIAESSKLLVINSNPVDYVLDGYSFINKQYLKQILTVSEDTIDFKILNMKCNQIESDIFSEKTIENFTTLLNYFILENSLIELEFESDKYCIIGKVIRLNEKSFVINKLNIEGEFIGEENYKINLLRKINLETDYLKSLDNYIKSKKY